MIPFVDQFKKYGLYLVVALALVFTTVSWIRARFEASAASQRAAQEAQLRDQAVAQAAKGAEAVDRAQALESQLNQERNRREELEARNADLEVELAKRPAPPKPGAPPSEQTQVLADLRIMGTSPEPYPPLKIAFPSSDAPTLWTWGKEAARVPGLEARLDAEGKLVLGLQGTLTATKAELSTTGAQRDAFRDAAGRFEAAHLTDQKQLDICKVDVTALTGQRDRARATRVYVGLGAFLAGGYLGYRLKGR